jgi:anti-anti-sigma factor
MKQLLGRKEGDMKSIDEPVKILTLEGNLTINRAEEVKNKILESFMNTKQVLLNLAHAENIDVSFIQILYAAKNEARKQKKEFHLTGTVKENVLRSFIMAGVTKGSSLDARDLENTLLDFSSIERA